LNSLNYYERHHNFNHWPTDVSGGPSLTSHTRWYDMPCKARADRIGGGAQSFINTI